MKKVLCLAAVMAVCSTAAFADVTWTLDNIVFTDGTTATGTFTTNAALNGFDSFNITVTTFTVSQAIPFDLPGEVGFANSDFSNYFALAFASPLTNAGGVDDVVFGSITYGGHTYYTGDEAQGTISSNANVNGGTVPEPASIVLLGSVMCVLGIALRKKLLPTS